MGKIVRAIQCNNRLEADMYQALLASAGIQSFVTADDIGGLYGFKFTLTAAGGAQVLVAESDLEAAQAIIRNKPTS
jgi:hypothetical protein